MQKMTWYEAKDYMRDYNRRNNITSKSSDGPTCIMVAVISEDSFDKEYSLEERSYRFSNKEKAFISGMSGNSIFADSLDGSDRGVRLECYLNEEGNKDCWKVEYVYIQLEE